MLSFLPPVILKLFFVPTCGFQQIFVSCYTWKKGCLQMLIISYICRQLSSPSTWTSQQAAAVIPIFQTPLKTFTLEKKIPQNPMCNTFHLNLRILLFELWEYSCRKCDFHVHLKHLQRHQFDFSIHRRKMQIHWQCSVCVHLFSIRHHVTPEIQHVPG